MMMIRATLGVGSSKRKIRKTTVSLLNSRQGQNQSATHNNISTCVWHSHSAQFNYVRNSINAVGGLLSRQLSNCICRRIELTLSSDADRTGCQFKVFCFSMKIFDIIRRNRRKIFMEFVCRLEIHLWGSV